MVGIIEPTRPPPVERKECEVCNSCGTPLVGKGYTKFKCINCEIWIGRCRKCRTNSRKYLCGKLDDVCFEGP
ncbi:MAG: RNA-binding protein [Chloroflexi bacterium]|nr:RNA-binding protein [Chloroflexota bacterium]